MFVRMFCSVHCYFVNTVMNNLCLCPCCYARNGTKELRAGAPIIASEPLCPLCVKYKIWGDISPYSIHNSLVFFFGGKLN